MIADTYRVTHLLGRGGMGSVWQADHVRLPGKRVAIKVLHSDVAGDPDALARFRREAEIASRLGHPNIVEVHDFNTLAGGEPYLVLELLVGHSLDRRIARGPLDLDSTTAIAGQIASALAAAHAQGVVHRDLKPHNVYLIERDDADSILVKVLDFGISKIRGSQTVKTQDSTILGTPQYMAPEQALGQHDAVSPATDVFALGAMVYEMLAGQPAFTGHNVPEVVFKVVYEQPISLAELRPDVPARVVEAVHKALAKKPEERFGAVDEFVEQLAGVSLSTLRKRPLVLADQSSEAGAADPLAATVDSSRRNRASFVPPDMATEAGTAATVATGGGAEAAAPRRRRRWLWPAVAVGVVAAAVAALLVVQNGESDKQATTTPAPAIESESELASATDTDTESASVTEPDTESETATESVTEPEPESVTEPDTESVTEPASASVAEPKSVTGPKKTPESGLKAGAGEKVAVSEDARNELRAGNEALARGDFRQALVHAERARNYGAGARAWFVRTMAYCGLRDLGNARGSYAQLPKRSSLRRKAKRFCSSQRQMVGD